MNVKLPSQPGISQWSLTQLWGHPIFQEYVPEFRNGAAEGVDAIVEGKAECPGGKFVYLDCWFSYCNLYPKYNTSTIK